MGVLVEGVFSLCFYALKIKLTQKWFSENSIPANHCLILLITNLGSHASQGCDELLPFISRQTQSTRFISNTHVLSLLALIHKVSHYVKSNSGNICFKISFCIGFIIPFCLYHKVNFFKHPTHNAMLLQLSKFTFCINFNINASL